MIEILDIIHGIEKRLKAVERREFSSAKIRNEITIHAVSTRSGSSAPTATNRAVGASGGVLLSVFQFSQITQQDCYFEIHAPEDLDNSVNVQFHLMWLPGSGWTTGNYVWKLEYLVKSEDDNYNTGTPTTISMNVTPVGATLMMETEFTDTINLDREQMLICHFYRDVASDNADDTGDVNFFEIEYTADRIGEPV